ncbi:MAG: SDR family oxidoreductase [Ignavibacteriales bacterium]|nr:SDR family oxidoreductase [Ignavibacteriales bacterium]
MNISFDDIKGKVIVIIGGCGVIGGVFTKALMLADAKVVILDYKKERCEKFADSLQAETNKKVFCAIGNILDKQSLIEAKKLINVKLGKVDVLINAAGGNSPKATTSVEEITKENSNDLSKTFFGLDIEGFKNVFDLNLYGTILPTMVFAEDMINRGGVVINISSMNAFRPLTKIPAYSAAKASINNLTEWMAVHFAKVNIRVNAIAPGFFLTKQNKFLLTDEKTGELTQRGHKIISSTPMGRFGEPEEILGTLFYLISNTSKFVTGVVIPVDGGFNAYSGV